MLQRLAAWAFSFLAGFLGNSGAAAQSIELVYEQAEIGRPLLLRWQVRPFDLDPNRMQADCLAVHLSAPGEDALPLPIDEQHLRPLADQGKVLLEVRSSTPVAEPLLNARVVLNCGAALSREFSILVGPSTGGMPHPPLQRPAGVSPGPVPESATARTTAPSPPRDTDRLRLDPPRQHSAAAALREDQVLAIAQAVAALLLQQQSHRTSSAQPETPPDATAWDNELRQLRQDQQQARAQLATLQLRLERQQDRLPTQWTSALLGAAGLFAAAAWVRLWREHRLPRWKTVARQTARPSTPQPVHPGAVTPAAQVLRELARQRRQEPAFHTTDGASFDGLPAADAVAAMPTSTPAPPGSLAAAGPPDRLGGPPVAAESAGATMSLDWPATDPHVSPDPGGQHPPWAKADFGLPDLDAPARSEAIERLDQMARDGYRGACIALLEHALQSRPGKNPRLLLRLLAQYQQLEQAPNHDRVAAQLEALFNLRVPLLVQRSSTAQTGWTDDPPVDWADLSAIWVLPEQAQAWLRQRLLPGPHPRLTLLAFEDALCLFDITREKLRDASPDCPSTVDGADTDPAGMDRSFRSDPPIGWTAWPGASAA